MVSTLDRMKQQRDEASFKFSPFFRMADKERALIRPQLDMSDALTIWFHKFFDKSNNKYVEVVCACELPGKQKCLYCQAVEEETDTRKKDQMARREVFMLPVWLYAIQCVKTENGMEVLDENDNPVLEKKTYKDKDSGDEKLVCGIRIMQLAFKKTSFDKVTNAFFDMSLNGDNIMDRDFIIARVGAGTDTSYTPSKRNPAPFKVDLAVYKESPVTPEWLKQKVFEIAPPQTADSSSANPFEDAPRKAVETPAKGSKVAEDKEDMIEDF